MPLARIITHSVEAAAPVIKQLKARGYTVETALPGESCNKPADLEIVLEKAKSDAVLSRAASLFEGTDCNVYIGAGAFRARPAELPAPEPRSVTTLPVPTVEDTVNGVAAGLQNKRDLLAKALWEQRANMREARRLQRERVRQEQARVAAEAERLRVEEERVQVRAAAEAERQRALEIAAREQAERERILAEHAEADRLFREQQALAEVPLASEERAELHDEAPVDMLQGANETASQLVAGANVASESSGEAAVAEGALAEEKPEPSVPVELAVATQGVAASRQLEPAPVTEPHEPRSRPRQRISLRRRSVRVRTREWRAAVIVSSIFALVLMLAWRVVSRGPVSPMPTAVTNQTNLQQEVPFGGVTLAPPSSNSSGTLAPVSHPGGKILRPVAADLHGFTPAQRASSENAAGQSVADKRSKTSAVKSAGKTKRSGSRTSRPRRQSEDDIAEDEVIIRHFSPKPATPPAEQKASLKKYSDLD